MRFAHLAQSLFNRPLMILPSKAEMLMAVLAQRMGALDLSRVARANGEIVSLEVPDWDDGARAERKPYQVVQGIAIIPVEGTLVHKLDSLQPWCGMTGYDGIRACFLDAVHDAAVRGICLSIDSPGGDVSGCFDLVDTIAAARGRKPIHAILDEAAYSAAYAIASAADRISVPRTGGVGSIGVIALIADLTKALDREGIKVNVLTFGARKADGQPFLELSPEARARFQNDIDVTGELFVSTVARNRKLSPAAIRATQAACFQGGEGVQIGLADVVAAPDAAFRDLLSAAQ